MFNFTVKVIFGCTLAYLEDNGGSAGFYGLKDVGEGWPCCEAQPPFDE